jgi:hypothetical protein
MMKARRLSMAAPQGATGSFCALRGHARSDRLFVRKPPSPAFSFVLVKRKRGGGGHPPPRASPQLASPSGGAQPSHAKPIAQGLAPRRDSGANLQPQCEWTVAEGLHDEGRYPRKGGGWSGQSPRCAILPPTGGPKRGNATLKHKAHCWGRGAVGRCKRTPLTKPKPHEILRPLW